MLSCNQYDYIEIVCMYRYPIKLTMKAGNIIEGVALDTQPNERIKMKIGDAETLVNLDEISKLEVQIENPHFTEITF